MCWILCTPGHTQFLGRHKSLIKLLKAPGGLEARYIACMKKLVCHRKYWISVVKVLQFPFTFSLQIDLKFANWIWTNWIFANDLLQQRYSQRLITAKNIDYSWQRRSYFLPTNVTVVTFEVPCILPCNPHSLCRCTSKRPHGIHFARAPNWTVGWRGLKQNLAWLTSCFSARNCRLLLRRLPFHNGRWPSAVKSCHFNGVLENFTQSRVPCFQQTMICTSKPFSLREATMKMY